MTYNRSGEKRVRGKNRVVVVAPAGLRSVGEGRGEIDSDNKLAPPLSLLLIPYLWRLAAARSVFLLSSFTCPKYILEMIPIADLSGIFKFGNLYCPLPYPKWRRGEE